MNYDDLLAYIGTRSVYQLRNYILLCIPIILCAFHKLSNVFILGKMDHRCKLSVDDENFFLSPENSTALNIILNSSFPYDHDKGFSKCKYFTDNYFVQNETTAVNREIQKCSDFLWDTTHFQSSALQTFQLVCDQSWYKAFSDSLFMIGVFIGSFCFGHASDKYGRRKVFVLSLIFQLIFGFLTAFSTNFFSFAIFRMIVGATTSGVFLVAYCLALESVEKDLRMVAGVFFMMFFSFGFITMGIIALFINEWRMYQIAITIPGCIFLAYWWFIPESNRWLLSNGQKAKAVKQIQKIARSNNVELPKDMINKFVNSENNDDNNCNGGKKPSILVLYKLPHLRIKALLIFFNWFVVSGAYYGLSWSSGDLVGDPVLNHIISGTVEIPGYILLLLTLNRFGRKRVLAANLTFAGILLLISLLVPKNITWLVISLTMLGKMCITASYGTIYLFSVEQFPTVIRNVALGCCSMAARVGSAASPFLIHLSHSWEPLPILIFGLTAFLAGFLTTFLEETVGHDLPDSLADTLPDAEKKATNADVLHKEELADLNTENIKL